MDGKQNRPRSDDLKHRQKWEGPGIHLPSDELAVDQSGNVEHEKEELKTNQKRPQIKTRGIAIGIGHFCSLKACDY